MPQALLQLSDLDAGYGKRQVLRGINLHVAERQVVAVLGHNGAGKTTLGRVMAGLLRPTRGGRYALGGTRVGYVPQLGNVFSELTVAENVAVALGGKAPMSAVYEWIGRFPALSQRSNLLAQKLSGGQRQILATAMCLARRPDLLVLDEPFTGVAPVVIDDILTGLRASRDESGCAIVLIEQNATAALRLADTVLVLREGHEAYHGPPVGVAEAERLWSLF